MCLRPQGLYSLSILSTLVCLAFHADIINRGGIDGGVGILRVDAFTTSIRNPTAFPSKAKHGDIHIFEKKTPNSLVFRSTSSRDERKGKIVLHATAHAGQIQDGDSNINDFQPTTMPLTKSMVFFAKYLGQQVKEDHIKSLITKENKKGLFRRSVSIDKYDPKLIERLKAEIEQEAAERKPFRETLSTLNKARKEMTSLVGYDAALLLPCFGFAGLAAFMNSVIPHYYGLCINCLANAATTTQSDIIKAITGLAIANLLCALFTGIRGALFWLAGMSL